MADGPPVEQNVSRAPMEKLKGFLERFRKPSPTRHNQTSKSRPTIKAEPISEGQEKSHTTTAPAPTTEVKQEEPPIVPEIKNDSGNASVFQVILYGKAEGQWQYAIRDRHSVDAHAPRGHLIRTGTSKESDGTVLHFRSMDEAIDFALAKNRKSTEKGWTDPVTGTFYETVHYDPRVKAPEEEKT